MKAGSPFLFMKNLLTTLLVLFVGCDAVEEELAGKLMRVEVTIEDSDCAPARFRGDAGIQFFGERPDGGLVFTMGQNAQYGPTIDGGVLESVQRQLIPAPNDGRASVGEGLGCDGSFSNWERSIEGVRVTQSWPGADTCPMGPIWLPSKGCTTTRRYSFTEVGTCQLRCVRISTSGEVDCTC